MGYALIKEGKTVFMRRPHAILLSLLSKKIFSELCDDTVSFPKLKDYKRHLKGPIYTEGPKRFSSDCDKEMQFIYLFILDV